MRLHTLFLSPGILCWSMVSAVCPWAGICSPQVVSCHPSPWGRWTISAALVVASSISAITPGGLHKGLQEAVPLRPSRLFAGAHSLCFLLHIFVFPANYLTCEARLNSRDSDNNNLAFIQQCPVGKRCADLRCLLIVFPHISDWGLISEKKHSINNPHLNPCCGEAC